MEDLNELNKRIATMLGWQPRIMQEREYHDLYEHGFGVSGWVQVYDCDELAFEYLPNWAAEMNDAINLLDKVDANHTPRLVRILQPTESGKYEFWWKCVILSNTGGEESYEAYERTPALAICKAWLTYCDEKPY